MENNQENWRSLHERLRGIARRRAALDAEEARCLREACAMRLWRQLGYAHMNEYLERELGYSPQVGIERLRVAHSLAELPLLEAGLGAGDLAFSAVRELTRVATAETEQDWLEKVRGKNLRQIEAMVSGKKRGDRPEDPSNPDLIMRVVRLELAPAVFALFRQVQSAMADEHGGRLEDSALIEVMCRRALEGGSQADHPAYQLAITQCEGCGRAWQNGAGREIDVGRDVVERARCDAELVGRLEASDPERVRTTVTPRVRRQVFARDHYRCTVPGCRSARNLDIHHIEYQRDGGGHEMQNLTILCSAHHAALHEDRLTIGGTAPDALEFGWRERNGPEGAEVDLPQDDHDIGPAERPDPSSQTPDVRVDNRVPQVRSVSRVGGTPEDPSDAMRITQPQIKTLPRSATSSRIDSGAAANRPVTDANARTVDEEACLALTTAGYRAREARAAVETARPHVGASATLEQVIREALRQCGSVAMRPGPSSL